MQNGRIINFNDRRFQLPQRIVLDANILVNQFKPVPTNSQKDLSLYNDSRDFFNRLKGQTFCKAYIPQTVIRECCNRLSQAVLAAYANSRNITVNGPITNLLKMDPNNMQRSNLPQRLSGFFNIIGSINAVIVQPHDFFQNSNQTPFEPDILNYLSTLKLQYEDASIVVDAERLGVQKIASVDKDFKRIVNAGFDLYTSSSL